MEHFRHWHTTTHNDDFPLEEHRASWLVSNCPNKAKEITVLPSSEQTGTDGDELAVPKITYYCLICDQACMNQPCEH